MQMNQEARAWLDATVRRILARHPVGDPERAGITYELMSHLHAAGEASATAAGRSEVTRADLEAAHAQAGADAGLAAAFVQPLAKPLVRVLFWRRLGGFAIDALLVGIALSFLHGALVFFLDPVLATRPPASHELDLWGLFPWGFHDPMLSVGVQAAIAVMSGILVLGYFTATEGRDGRSFGKYAVGIRVMRADGSPLTYREALIRNIAKLSPPLLALDTLIMILASQHDKQRVSDRIAQTIVVRA